MNFLISHDEKIVIVDGKFNLVSFFRYTTNKGSNLNGNYNFLYLFFLFFIYLFIFFIFFFL